MSGLQPLFASAPRIKLYIDQQLVAYAIGFNFNVSVDVQPVFILGKYGPAALEPTMYNTVTGTLQIVRLKNPTVIANSGGKTSIKTKAGAAGTEAKGSVTATNTPISQKELFKHITPGQLILSQAFNMQLYMKIPSAEAAVAAVAATASTDAVPAKAAILSKTALEEVEWMRIEGCRITSRNTNISMGQLVNEPLNFQGLLATHASSSFALDGKVTQGGALT